MAAPEPKTLALATTAQQLRAYFVAQDMPPAAIEYFLVDCANSKIKDFLAWFKRGDYEDEIKKELEAKFTVGVGRTKPEQRLMVARTRIAYQEALAAQEAADAKAKQPTEPPQLDKDISVDERAVMNTNLGKWRIPKFTRYMQPSKGV